MVKTTNQSTDHMRSSMVAWRLSGVSCWLVIDERTRQGEVMNRRIFEIIDELTKREHHWTWYQFNGKSAQENYALQKAQWHKEFLGRQLKELL